VQGDGRLQKMMSNSDVLEDDGRIAVEYSTIEEVEGVHCLFIIVVKLVGMQQYAAV
jgi:hypothetical protein